MKVAEINRFLKNEQEFNSRLEALGFKKGPSSVWFYRNREPFIDIISFWLSSSGNFLDVPVVCFKRDLVDHCDMTKFPKGFITDMPLLSDSFVSKSDRGVEWTKSPWRIKDKKELSQTMDLLIQQIENKVNKWFLNIDTDKNFFETFPPYAREDEYGLMIKSKLKLT